MNLPTEEKMIDAVEVAAEIVREHYLFEPSLKAAMGHCQ